MKIESIMTKPVVSVRRTVSIKDVVKKMAAKKIGSVVITEKKIPIGIFTRTDLMHALVSEVDFNKTAVGEVMHTPVQTVKTGDKFLHAARRMKQFDVRHFIVVDEDEKLAGIVTDLDIVKNYALTYLSYQATVVSSSFEGLSATPATPLKKIAHMMLEERKSCTVILKGKKPVGIVNEALFASLSARYKDPLKFKAGEKMIKKYCGAKPEGSLREAVLDMSKKGMRNIVLADEKRNFAGVLSLRELVAYIINQQM